MALCVELEIGQDGYLLAPTGQTVADCTGYVMVTPAEYAWLDLMQLAFASPTVEQAGAYFVGGFGGILSIYVVARICGAIASYFD